MRVHSRISISWLHWLALLFACALISFWVVGYSYPFRINPKQYPPQFIKIDVDGWVQQGSRIELPELATRGNRIDLQFRDWHPPGVAAAHLQVRLCGKVVADFVVEPPKLTQTVYLSADCEPRQLEFVVLNPFRPSLQDQRDLGAQLESAIVYSPLGPPLVNPARMFLVFAALLALVSVALITAVEFRFMLPLAYAIPIGAIALVLDGAYAKWDLLGFVALSCVLILLGVALVAKLNSASDLLKSGEFSTSLVDAPLPARYTWMIVGALLLVAAVIRFYGLQFGLPEHYHSDEPRKVAVMTRMLNADSWDPKYFLHPSLLLYSTIFTSKLITLLGLNVAPTDLLYVSGRTVSALAGTISVGLLFLLGLELFTWRIGLLAALSFLGMPLHTTCSRYMKEDALFLAFFLAAALLVARAVVRNSPRQLLLAGLLAGLSASSKYTGILSIALLVSAPWLHSGTWRPSKLFLRWAFLGALLMPIGFVLATPYSVLNFEGFREGFGSESKHMVTGHTVAITAWSQYWMFHLSRSLVPGMTWIALALALLGIGVLIAEFKMRGLFVVAMALMFYMVAEWVRAKPAPQPERYILPCLPFLALTAAYAVERIVASRFRVLGYGLASVLILAPFVAGLQLASELRYDTRQQMADWMKANLPAHAKVLVNGEGYSPRLWDASFEVQALSRQDPEKFQIQALQNSGYDYVLLSSLAYDRFFSQYGREVYFRYFRQRFVEIFRHLPLVHEVQPKYGTYGFHNPTLRLYDIRAK